MKTVNWILSFAFAMAFSFAVQAQNVQGVMMVVKGDIKVTSADGKTEVAKVGKKVSAGDTITAGPDSRAKIVMADKNVINVSPDSKIVIEKYENDGKDKKNVELNVLYGKVRASVEQKYDGDKSKFNVKTPSAVAGVRGTDFMTGYNAGTKTAQFITFSGSVAVGQPGPGGTIKNPVFVQAGQMTQAGAGKPPEAPKAMSKDDLNKAAAETKADSASNSKQDSGQTQAETKADDKKDPKDEKKEDKREPASENGDKPADKKDDKKSDKREPASENGDKPADKGGDRPTDKGSNGDKSADTKGGDSKSPGGEGGRTPASNSGGGMVNMGDLPGGPSGGMGGLSGPGGPGGISGPPVPPLVIKPPIQAPIGPCGGGACPPPPPVGSKSKVNITITAPTQ